MFDQPLPHHRLFFAVKPPRSRARQLASAAPWFDTAGKAVWSDRLHITAFILDDLKRVPDMLLAQLTDIGAALTLAAFNVTLDRAVGSRSLIALRPSRKNDGLTELHRRLSALARAAGVAEREAYRFSPHLTLGYREGEPFQQRIAPVGWRAEEVVLIHRHLGRTRHEELGRWQLREDRETRVQLALF